MSAALDIAPRLGAEFRGLARKFRDEVRAIDAEMNAMVAAIMKPLHGRLKKHPRLRHEQVQQAQRIYRLTVPATCRLGDVLIDPDRAKFSITETRLTATVLNALAWQDSEALEPGVAVADFCLKLTDGKLRQWWEPKAICSLHSLARRIERGEDRSHAALIRDLAVLAEAPEDGDVVMTSDGGCWAGSVIRMRGPNGVLPVRHVRTWKP
jgi:hypothetical protein